MSLVLSDNSGSVEARVWDNVDLVSDLFQSGDLVRVKGAVQMFQGRKQVVVHKLERVEPSEHDMNQFMSQAAKAPALLIAPVITSALRANIPSIACLATASGVIVIFLAASRAFSTSC